MLTIKHDFGCPIKSWHGAVSGSFLYVIELVYGEEKNILYRTD